MPDVLTISHDLPTLNNPKALNFETQRLGTFHGWKSPVSAIKLAKHGFSATSNEDEVQCFSCKEKRRGWVRDMDPSHVHRRDCCMVSANPASATPPNIPIPVRNPASVILTSGYGTFRSMVVQSGIQESGQVAPDGNVHTFPGVRMRNWPRVGQTVASVIPRQSDLSLPFTAQVQPGPEEVPQLYTEFSSALKRRTSFLHFPQGHLVDELTRLGFFYVGHSDIVLCHSCGLGLCNWDAGDDPKIVHVRWRCSCLHLQSVLTPGFIQRTRLELAIIGAAS